MLLGIELPAVSVLTNFFALNSTEIVNYLMANYNIMGSKRSFILIGLRIYLFFLKNLLLYFADNYTDVQEILQFHY